MAKFRKLPVEIEAHQLGDKGPTAPTWYAQAVLNGTIDLFSDGSAVIPTLEGDMTAQPGDWIIRGVKGEMYPIKPDIFAETYEPVDG